MGIAAGNKALQREDSENDNEEEAQVAHCFSCFNLRIDFVSTHSLIAMSNSLDKRLWIWFARSMPISTTTPRSNKSVEKRGQRRSSRPSTPWVPFRPSTSVRLKPTARTWSPPAGPPSPECWKAMRKRSSAFAMARRKSAPLPVK